MSNHDQQAPNRALGWSKAQVERLMPPADEVCALVEGVVEADQFSYAATCGAKYANECLGPPDLLPMGIDRYSTMQVLIAWIGVMSLRWGLYEQPVVRKACAFLDQLRVDQLNGELAAGRSFLWIPTNKPPRLVDQEVSLVNLRQVGGDLYPGYLLDVAAAVAQVNVRVRAVRGDS